MRIDKKESITYSKYWSYYNLTKNKKKFDWVSNSVCATADISDLNVNDICDFYRYIPFPKLGDYTSYKDSSFTSLLLKS